MIDKNFAKKTRCHRDGKFRKVTFENQGISGNSKKRGAPISIRVPMRIKKYGGKKMIILLKGYKIKGDYILEYTENL